MRVESLKVGFLTGSGFSYRLFGFCSPVPEREGGQGEGFDFAQLADKLFTHTSFIERRRGALHYGTVKDCDIANGDGVRVSLFVSGCTNHCEHCFQPQTWDFEYGQPFTDETEARILELLSPPYIAGLSLLGGEPFEPSNQRVLTPFLRRVREAYPTKNVWCYSGFTLEELRTEGSYPRCEVTDEMLSLLDVLVDGRFVEALKDISLRFRGSRNQRLIDLNATRRTGEIVCLSDRRTL